jgi:thiol-disulfide isomerase/thioredoxin
LVRILKSYITEYFSMRIIIYTFFLAIFFTSFSAKAQNKPFNITIKVDGVKSEDVILAYYYGDKKYIIDTLKVDANGVAKIEGTKEIPKGVYIYYIPSKNKMFEFILSEYNFSLTTDTIDFVKNMKSKGSVENKIFFEFLNYVSSIGPETDSLSKVFKTLTDTNTIAYKSTFSKLKANDEAIINKRKQIVKDNPNAFYSSILKTMIEVDMPNYPAIGTHEDSLSVYYYARQHALDNINFADSGLVRTPVFLSKLHNYIRDYSHPNPDSIAIACDYLISKCNTNQEMFKFCVSQLLSKYAASEIMGHEAIYVHLVENYYLNGKAFWQDTATLKKMTERVLALRPTLLGSIAPNFNVLDTLGNIRTLHNEVIKNDFTILVFWNSDCGHCREEIPKLYKLWQDTLKFQNIGVFSVATDRERVHMSEFIQSNKLFDWAHGYDPIGTSMFRRQYDVLATPLIVIIDKSKNIKAKRIAIQDIYGFIMNLKEK